MAIHWFVTSKQISSAIDSLSQFGMDDILDGRSRYGCKNDDMALRTLSKSSVSVRSPQIPLSFRLLIAARILYSTEVAKNSRKRQEISKGTAAVPCFPILAETAPLIRQLDAVCKGTVQSGTVLPRVSLVVKWCAFGEKRKGRHTMQFGTPASEETKQVKQKRIALVAHDNKKRDLLEWAKLNKDFLAQHKVYATRTTGKLLEQELHIGIIKLESGPLGGVQQIGAKIVDGDIDFLVFFGDVFASLPYDPDASALLRIAVVWNIPVALNRISADCIFSSPLISGEYRALHDGYRGYGAEHDVKSMTLFGNESGHLGEECLEGYVDAGDGGGPE